MIPSWVWWEWGSEGDIENERGESWKCPVVWNSEWGEGGEATGSVALCVGCSHNGSGDGGHCGKMCRNVFLVDAGAQSDGWEPGEMIRLCQLDTSLHIPGGRKLQLRYCLHQIGLGACLGGVFVFFWLMEEDPGCCGLCQAWAGGPEIYKKGR